jgi:hypothetical protein
MPTITHSLRQQPVATALDQLLADAEATARAIEDNTHEDGQPVDPLAALNWWNRLDRIAAAITNASATKCHASYLPAYPSFTGKELV